jgi:hypothetical protein
MGCEEVTKMTTQVTISSPSPNHENVRVRLFAGHPECDEERILTDGESVTYLLYSDRYIEIEEIAKVR